MRRPALSPLPLLVLALIALSCESAENPVEATAEPPAAVNAWSAAEDGSAGLAACDFVPQDPEACVVGCRCYSFEIVEVASYPALGTVAERTEITFAVTNYCKWAVSYIAIGTGGLVRVAEGQGGVSLADGSLYTGEQGPYRIEWTNLIGNPGFEAVKFNALREGFTNGETEHFTIAVEGYRSDYQFNLQAHGGSIFETFSGLSTQWCSPSGGS